MFGFLKNKLKEVISKFSRGVEKEAKPVEEPPQKTEDSPPKQKETAQEKTPEAKKEHEPKKESKKTPEKPEPGIEHPIKEKEREEHHKQEHESLLKPHEKSPKPETIKPEEIKNPEPKEEKQSLFDLIKRPFLKQEPKEPVEEKKRPEEKTRTSPEEKKGPEPKEIPEEKKGLGFFDIIKDKITKKTLSEKQFDELFWDLEMALLENNVAVEVIDRIKDDLKQNLVNRPLERNKIDSIIISTLKDTIQNLFNVEGINILHKIKSKKPYVICFVGINGSGKTTTIAKIGHLLKNQGISSVIAASDTFRAAAIQQLEEHANRLNIKMIKHDYGADSAAVAFDAISHAKAHNIDVVLIDTAGRLHSNINLMDEIKKVKRVTKPDLIIFVGESITGNDCVEQAKTFDKELGIDGIILAKSDIDEKGGTAVSISYVTHKPILYLGTGQGYDDLVEFDPKIIIKSLGLEI